MVKGDRGFLGLVTISNQSAHNIDQAVNRGTAGANARSAKCSSTGQ